MPWSALLLVSAQLCFSATLHASDDEALYRRAVELARATQFEEARSLFEQLRESAAAEGDREFGVDVALGLCDLERDSGNPAGGLIHCDRALALFGPGVDPALEPRIHRQRAQVRTAIGDREGASADLDLAASLYATLGNDLEVAGVNAVRSVMATWQGDWASAVRYGRAAFPVLLEHREMAEAVGALSGIAYGLQEMGSFEEALEAYDQLVDLAFERNDQRMMNFAFCNRATVRWALRQDKASEKDLRRAISGIEETRLRIQGDPEARRDYFGQQRSAYDDLILLLAETYRGEEAFDTAERFHGRSLLELLDEGDLDRVAADDPQRRRERELLSAIGAARLESERPDRTDAPAELEKLRAELRALRAEIRRTDPGYASLVAPEPADAEATRQALLEGEVLVAYWVGQRQTFAWAVSGESTHFVVIPIPRGELESKVAAYLEPLRSAERARDAAIKGTEAKHLKLGTTLYRWLVGSLPRSVREAERMVLVLDDFLNYLPFEALIESCETGSAAQAAESPIHGLYAGCRYLGLEHALTYAPSAGVFRALRLAGERASRGGLLAMAPYADEAPEAVLERSAAEPLPRLGALRHSQEEVDRIAAFHERSSRHLASRATETLFKTRAPASSTLHLATHGLIDDRKPMSSGVLLQPSAEDDGLLQANEVIGLDLDAELVTLSACSTGRGALHHGEGIVGLSRSFLHAGARSVVVSMWDVDDRTTPILMEAFYAGIARGLGPSEALREARRNLFEQVGTGRLIARERQLAYAHPRYWAAFVVNGSR